MKNITSQVKAFFLKKLPFFIIIVICILSAYNIYKFRGAFFKISIEQVMTILVAVGIAFWATQRKNDQRKMKEEAERIIEKIQSFVSSDCFINIPSDGDTETIQRNINAYNRKINNYISILNEYGQLLSFSDETDYIQKTFEEYKSTVGNHINNPDYLSDSSIDFERMSANINNKCEEIIVKLYK